jgi:predicted nucleic acid-binding Zn ribbon protein
MNRRNAQSLSDVITEFLAENDELRERLYISRIQRAWGEVLGATIMQYTKNVYVKNKTLYVSLSSSVLRNELVLNRAKLVKSLNDHVGASVITDIVIR